MDLQKRTGDNIKINGDYQYKALQYGNIVQRYWHQLKLTNSASTVFNTPKGDVLDIGCGSGVLKMILNNHYNTYTGIDANEEAIKFCTNYQNVHNEIFQVLTFDELSTLPNKHYHTIFFLECIEHVTLDQGIEIIRACRNLLKPDGSLIITTPNKKSLWPLIEKLLDIFKLVPALKGEQHAYLYTVAKLNAIAKEAGFLTKRKITFNGIAPWLSFLGKRVTNYINEWECRTDWLPGSLILLELINPSNDQL